MYKLKDIRNIISRLKKERKELLAAQTANAALPSSGDSGETTQHAATTALSVLASSSSQQTSVLSEVSKNLPVVVANGTEASTISSPSKVSLARLELLLDSPYSYREAYQDVSSLQSQNAVCKLLRQPCDTTTNQPNRVWYDCQLCRSSKWWSQRQR